MLLCQSQLGNERVPECLLFGNVYISHIHTPTHVSPFPHGLPCGTPNAAWLLGIHCTGGAFPLLGNRMKPPFVHHGLSLSSPSRCVATKVLEYRPLLAIVPIGRLSSHCPALFEKHHCCHSGSPASFRLALKELEGTRWIRWWNPGSCLDARGGIGKFTARMFSFQQEQGRHEVGPWNFFTEAERWRVGSCHMADGSSRGHRIAVMGP